MTNSVSSIAKSREGHPSGGNGHNSTARIEMVDLGTVRLNPASARKFSNVDEKRGADIVRRFGVPPLILDGDNVVRVGELAYLGAKRAGLESVPVYRLGDVGKLELDAIQIAYTRLGELGAWDRQALGTIFVECEADIAGFEVEQIGFDVTFMDLAINDAKLEPDADVDEEPAKVAISAVGDLWRLDDHRLLCGSATEPSTFATLMGGASASAVFSDPPFGCGIDGFVAGKGRHREFVMASGEMSDDELLAFFAAFISAFLPYLKTGAVVYLVIDWRSLHLLQNAAAPLLGKLLNMAVWVKDRAGLGSFLRSQHEFVLIYKVGKGRFRNNVQLGATGRHRSNVWNYPSAKTASKGSDEGNLLASHPTPKPVALVADAILDCTKRGEIVIDAFLGSGTTLIAAEKVGRRCYATELDPLYVDLAVRRWQAWTGRAAAHAVTGRTFDETAADRLSTL